MAVFRAGCDYNKVMDSIHFLLLMNRSKQFVHFIFGKTSTFKVDLYAKGSWCPIQQRATCIGKKGLLAVLFLIIYTGTSYSQSETTTDTATQAYFIDGYHGGIWGHFPYKYASFIADQMRRHPKWKVNLEIEPVTWDSIESIDPNGYLFIKKQLMDTTGSARMEYINPAYGQSYMFNISGESIIRQFYYGMQTLRRHFPGIQFSSYSSEEPCFTSQLPGILSAFGFKYASLKNPNTCWGGYTRAHAGELIYWKGPDGSSLLTVPRYSTESLQKGSTWQTIAWRNSPDYIYGAIKSGIQYPVGMCLQDAGWTVGPWLGSTNKDLQLNQKSAATYPRSVYMTWKGYFAMAEAALKAQVDGDNAHSGSLSIPEWKLSEEDIQVSLVWGGQILQRVARAVRRTENRLITAETLTTLNHLFDEGLFPTSSLDKAWKNLLLSQHHDCWIVPYNKKHGRNWQQQVKLWTDTALHIADSLINLNAANQAVGTLAKNTYKKRRQQSNQNIEKIPPILLKGSRLLKIYNSTGSKQTALVSYQLPAELLTGNAGKMDRAFQLLDPAGRKVDFQVVISQAGDKQGAQQTATIYFEPTVPAMGYAIYRLEGPGALSGQRQKMQKETITNQAKHVQVKNRPNNNGQYNAVANSQNIIRQLKNGLFELQTARYKLRVSPSKGGAITSLQLKINQGQGKKATTHEFIAVNKGGESAGLNVLRGYFYHQQRFRSSDEQPARVTVLANGPLYAALKIQGRIADAPFTQILQLSQNDPLIRTKLMIDWARWAGDPKDLGIGAYNQEPFDNKDPKKAFYNSRYKLLSLFPVNFKNVTIQKDAPFDIFTSRLRSTFFDRWDSIKNDVLLHWVNLQASDEPYGFALFSTATTSYAHGPGLPLGLTTQYIGRGLFGADYQVQGTTTIDYAFMPHAGDWKTGDAKPLAGVSNVTVPQAAETFNKPLVLVDLGAGAGFIGDHKQLTQSLLTLPQNSGWQVSAFKMADAEASQDDQQGSANRRDDNKGDKTVDKQQDKVNQAGSYLLRLFNATGDDQLRQVALSLPGGREVRQVELVDLAGNTIRQLSYNKNRQTFSLSIPSLGIRNIRIRFW